MSRYRAVIEREAIPLPGRLQITDIEPRGIKRYAVTIADRGVSANTVRLHLAPLRALFATAVEDGLIRYNPAAGVRNVYGRRSEIEHGKALSDEQLRAVIDAAPEPHRLLLRFLAETGLRISEAIALEWQDVDVERGRLVVRRRISQGTVDAPKSVAGRRQVPLSSAMVAELHARLTLETRLTEPVFASRDGVASTPASNCNPTITSFASTVAGNGVDRRCSRCSALLEAARRVQARQSEGPSRVRRSPGRLILRRTA